MKIAEIRREADFLNLQPAWEGLVRESGVSIFLTWEWVSAWWASYGKTGALRILTVCDENGVLRGIAPLQARRLSRFGQTASTLSFAVDGSNDSEYLDFIIAAGYEDRVMEALLERFTEELSAGTVLELNEIQETAGNLPLLRRLAGKKGALWTEVDVPCATVRLPENWDEYLSGLRPRFRTKVRSVLRNLEGRDEVSFGFSQTRESTAKLLPVLFDLHGRRWAKGGKPGVFGWDQKRNFYAAVSPLLFDRDWLRMSWMAWNGRVLACQYGFVYNRTYFQLQEGYEATAEHLNPGIALRAWSIRELQRQGIREYDFLGGVRRGKTDWGADVKHSKQLLIAGDTLKNRLICFGPEWQERVKESIRRMLPEKVLATRAARLGEPKASGATGGEWRQKATANCYFYSRLPALMRPLRDRYQVAVRNNGTRRRFSWEKREQPAARILYYHRVNDRGDPFFPAISTALFEREMQFVARHYKVVSVPEVLDRLQGEAPEPVVAITFDDGYEDNYLNAFPILQRYGLPATIFLSTGSLDSRETLWFEELASALKGTACEYTDLEIDFPRRYFLRTADERLQANNDIFALLRRMDNRERKERLATIVRQLAVPADVDITSRMLSWDQVRLMSGQKMDFGGHTVTHPFLSRLTRDEADWEISECKRRIESELQRQVEYFAYPNGREEDFGKWNKDILRSAGYRAAMTTIWGLNYASTDPMELRRGGPWEDSAAQFAYKLDWYQWVNG